jgi:uncharacterized protein Usg
MSDLARQLDGYRLTTAEILYHLPDHPGCCRAISGKPLTLPRDFPSSSAS